MKPKLVVGNWKMNGSLAANGPLLEAVATSVPDGVVCSVCVPFPYLAQAAESLQGSAVTLGAQNVSEYPEGAYTGEVSAAMLVEFGCKDVIVGHSERRALFGETDDIVAHKAVAALRMGLRPIVCVGETLDEREVGQVETVLDRQLGALDAVLDDSQLGRIVIAYEPVWAIGTGRAATPEQVQRVLSWIRSWLVGHVQDAAAVNVLYGGSVKPDTAAELFGLPDCDGGLIGGASLVAADFREICRAAVSSCRV